jgi:hypothetical protein
MKYKIFPKNIKKYGLGVTLPKPEKNDILAKQ